MFLIRVMLVLIVPLLISEKVMGQFDTTYYVSYAEQITARFYFSQKYTNLIIEDRKNDLQLDYRPNTTLNMGVGGTYKWFTLNLAYGFAFLNQEKEKGKTDYLDLQAHWYGRKMNIDLFGQFYDGFYLNPKGKGKLDNSYYLRPDLNIREFGGSVQYLFNYKKFSSRAAFFQNEWQKKSAGSFHLGFEYFFGHIKADSTIYPSILFDNSLPTATKIQFFELGPNFGYNYSLIIAKHFFITGSLSLSLDYDVTNYTNIDNKGNHSESGVTPNALIRFFTGYNSEKNAVSLTFNNSRVSLSSVENNSLILNTGNLRINFVRRFIPGKKTKKFLRPIDWAD